MQHAELLASPTLALDFDLGDEPRFAYVATAAPLTVFFEALGALAVLV
jgi:hypothetical protein